MKDRAGWRKIQPAADLALAPRGRSRQRLWRAYDEAVRLNGEISVTYTGGVLKPDHRLELPEGARLRAVIRPALPEPATTAGAATHQRIGRISLRRPQTDARRDA